MKTSKTGFLVSSLIYYLHFDEVRGDFVGASHGTKHQLQLDYLTHNFTASLFYFRVSEGGNIGPYAHTPFNFINLTEIFLY